MYNHERYAAAMILLTSGSGAAAQRSSPDGDASLFRVGVRPLREASILVAQDLASRPVTA
jgi:hypothetical protein